MKRLILDTTDRALVAALGGTITTSQPEFVVSYVDKSASALTEASTPGAFNNATPVTLVAAPASGHTRTVAAINIFNKDTVAVTVTISYDDNGTLRTIWKGTLQAGEVKTADGVFDSNGYLKTAVPTMPTSGLSGTLLAAQFPALTGDVTTAAGALATTLATVNGNVGSFTAADLTVDAKGRITAAASAAATGTGNLVRASSPTIVTPTIASFVNANHDHTNAAGGGALSWVGAVILTGETSLGTGASFTINVPSQSYNRLLLILKLRSAAAVTIDTARLRFGDGVGLDSTTANYYNYRMVHTGTGPTQTPVETLGGSAYANFVATGASATANHTCLAYIYIDNYSTSSRIKMIKILNQYMYGTSTGNHAEESGSCYWLNTSKALTQIEVSCAGGNIASPSMYELRAA